MAGLEGGSGGVGGGARSWGWGRGQQWDLVWDWGRGLVWNPDQRQAMGGGPRGRLRPEGLMQGWDQGCGRWRGAK